MNELSDHDMLVSIKADLVRMRKDVTDLQDEVKKLNAWFNRVRGATYLILALGGVLGFMSDKIIQFFHFN